MRVLRFLFISFVSVLCLGLGYLLLTHPETPLPREWNPTKRLYLSDPVTLLTRYKLDAAAADPGLCKEVLAQGRIGFRDQPDLRDSAQCFIEGRVELARVGEMSMRPVQTTCAVALRTAMWARYGLQPAAKEHLGASISGLLHFSSFSCRPIRGSSTRMSLHATAEALDVAGVRLADGRTLALKSDWDAYPAFWHAVRDSACTWFKTVLGPDYNALHADHFHLQSRGWGTCR